MSHKRVFYLILIMTAFAAIEFLLVESVVIERVAEWARLAGRREFFASELFYVKGVFRVMAFLTLLSFAGMIVCMHLYRKEKNGRRTGDRTPDADGFWGADGILNAIAELPVLAVDRNLSIQYMNSSARRFVKDEPRDPDRRLSIGDVFTDIDVNDRGIGTAFKRADLDGAYWGHFSWMIKNDYQLPADVLIQPLRAQAGAAAGFVIVIVPPWRETEPVLVADDAAAAGR